MRRSETLRKTILTIAFCLAAGVSHAQDGLGGPFGDELSPTQAHLEDGFVEIPFSDGRGTPERKTIDDRFAAPLAETLGAKDYGFSFALLDLNGDGADDVALTLRVAVQVPFGEGAGAPTYVYLFDDGDWRLVAYDRSMVLASKVVDGSAADLAFVGEEGYVRFKPTAEGLYERTFLRGR